MLGTSRKHYRLNLVLNNNENIRVRFKTQYTICANLIVYPFLSFCFVYPSFSFLLLPSALFFLPPSAAPSVPSVTHTHYPLALLHLPPVHPPVNLISHSWKRHFLRVSVLWSFHLAFRHRFARRAVLWSTKVSPIWTLATPKHPSSSTEGTEGKKCKDNQRSD